MKKLVLMVLACLISSLALCNPTKIDSLITGQITLIGGGQTNVVATNGVLIATNGLASTSYVTNLVTGATNGLASTSYVTNLVTGMVTNNQPLVTFGNASLSTISNAASGFGFWVGASQLWAWGANASYPKFPLRSQNGTWDQPTYSFDNDISLGMYYIGLGDVGYSGRSTFGTNVAVNGSLATATNLYVGGSITASNGFVTVPGSTVTNLHFWIGTTAMYAALPVTNANWIYFVTP